MTNDAWMFTLLSVAYMGLGLLFLRFHYLDKEGTKAVRDLAERVAKIESAGDSFKITWSILEKAVMAAMHSPTDHMGLDNLVEKYFSSSYDLPQGDWEWMHDQCEAKLENQATAGDEKALALFGLHVSTHKLSQYGVVREKGVNKSLIPQMKDEKNA